MDYYFETNIKKIENYLEEYSTYNKIEKLDKIYDISDCFKKILKPRYVKYFDIKLIKKIHDMILSLDCLSMLVRFYFDR